MGQSQIILSCENPSCHQQFSKSLAEFRRNEKLGRQHFCSLKCFAQYKGKANFKDKINTDTSHLRNIIRRDELSPFRNYLKVIRKSVKQRKKESNLSLEDLRIIWDKQKGICPYTGWNLVILPCTTDYKITHLTSDRASIDRKNSSKGYTIENIQFVAVIANFAKNAFTEQELLEFCHAVVRFRELANQNHGKSVEIAQDNINETLHLQPEYYKYNQQEREDSVFRYYLKLARKNAKEKGKECSLTLDFLKNLWESQGGKCTYTGWKLDNLEIKLIKDNYQLHPRRASLDRIDSSLGYLPENVQFVSVIANYAKNEFHEKILLEFCKAVVDYRIKSY